jgi:hypothetical protein
LRFLDIALGSASEADYLLDFCLQVNLLEHPPIVSAKTALSRSFVRCRN